MSKAAKHQGLSSARDKVLTKQHLNELRVWHESAKRASKKNARFGHARRQIVSRKHTGIERHVAFLQAS